jgi:hypothetical protein
MSQNFFNPYDLVKKQKKDDKDSYLAMLKKQQNKPEPKLTEERKKNEPMLIEKIQVSSSKAEPAAKKIKRLVRAFLMRRRILRSTLEELKKKLNDIELLLVKMPTMRNMQFLKEAKLIELIRLATLTWISSSKYIQDGGFSKKQTGLQELRNQILTLFFKLNDMIVMSFERKTGRLSLIMYLLQEQSNNIILFISVLSFLKIIRKLDGTLDFIQALVWKRSAAQFYHTLFDTEDFVVNGRFLVLRDSSLDMAKDLLTEVIEAMDIHKVIALSMYSYLKVNPSDNGKLMKSYILGCFFGHFLSKAIIKQDTSFISPAKMNSDLGYSFECCFGYPLVGQYFRSDVLLDPKVGSVFMDLLEKLPTASLKQSPTVTFDSKLNTVINILYLLGKFMSEGELPSES